jgi:hypothetical protein
VEILLAAGTGKLEASLRRAADAIASVMTQGLKASRFHPAKAGAGSRAKEGFRCRLPFDAGADSGSNGALYHDKAMLYCVLSYLARTALLGVAADRKKLVAMRVNSRRLAEREFDREKTYAAFADRIETVRGGG